MSKSFIYGSPSVQGATSVSLRLVLMQLTTGCGATSPNLVSRSDRLPTGGGGLYSIKMKK